MMSKWKSNILSNEDNVQIRRDKVLLNSLFPPKLGAPSERAKNSRTTVPGRGPEITNMFTIRVELEVRIVQADSIPRMAPRPD